MTFTEAAEKYQDGFNIHFLARECGVNKKTLRAALLEHGVTIRGRGRLATGHLPASQGTGADLLAKDRRHRCSVAIGSENLLKAMLTYGMKNRGLAGNPSLSPEECRERLRQL